MEHKIMNPIQAVFDELRNGTLKADYFATAAALTAALEEAAIAVEKVYELETGHPVGSTELIATVVNLLLEPGDPTADPTAVLCQAWNACETVDTISRALGPAEQELVEQGFDEEEIYPINGSRLIPHIMEGHITGKASQTATRRTKAAFKWLEEHCAHSESVGDQIRKDPDILYGPDSDVTEEEEHND